MAPDGVPMICEDYVMVNVKWLHDVAEITDGKPGVLAGFYGPGAG